jgi:hypothetical protein
MSESSKFIRIKGSDFPTLRFRNAEEFLRSVEHYLVKYKREYFFRDRICLIYVNDQFDAMKLGLDLKLEKIEYSDGFRTLLLNLRKENGIGRPKNTIFDGVSGRGMTLNQFKKHSLKEIKESCLTKSEIFKRKIITKGKLEKALREGKIKDIKFGNATYIVRLDLEKLFKS